MKKTECAAEIERLRGLHRVEQTKVERVLESPDVPKKVAKKVKAVQEVEHKKQEEVVKKTKGIKVSAPSKEQKVEVPTIKEESKKPAKGSEEMRERMAKLREMRKKKE
jgi:hypothetical protein